MNEQRDKSRASRKSSEARVERRERAARQESRKSSEARVACHERAARQESSVASRRIGACARGKTESQKKMQDRASRSDKTPWSDKDDPKHAFVAKASEPMLEDREIFEGTKATKPESPTPGTKARGKEGQWARVPEARRRECQRARVPEARGRERQKPEGES